MISSFFHFFGTFDDVGNTLFVLLVGVDVGCCNNGGGLFNISIGGNTGDGLLSTSMVGIGEEDGMILKFFVR